MSFRVLRLIQSFSTCDFKRALHLAPPFLVDEYLPKAVQAFQEGKLER